MLKNFILICFFALFMVVTHARADISTNLDGLWIVDPKATEDFVAGAPLPPNADELAQWFGIAGGYMLIFTYEFKGNVALRGTLGPGDQVLEYQQAIKQGAETRYIPKHPSDSKADTFSVSVMDNGNIQIIQSKSPEMGHILWKRSQVQTKQISPEELMTRSKEWMASIENILKVLKSKP